MMTFVGKKNSRSHAARAALCALALTLALTMGLGPAEAETASPSNEGNGGQAAAGEKMASLPKEDDAYASGELLVVMRDTVSEKHMEDVAEDEGDALQDTTAIGTGDAKQTMAVVETGENDLENAMTSYAERSDVAYVQPNYIYTSADQGLTVKSTGSSVVDAQDVQWNLGANGIDAEKAWSIAESSRKSASKVKVAVLDTGLDTKQPDLQKNLDLADCRNVYSNSNKVTDYAGHGTHVAGIIAADNNEMGVTGVAAGTKNDLVQVFGVKVFNKDGSVATTASVIAGINWALQRGAKVINMSLGGISAALTSSEDKTLEKAVKQAYSKGVTVVCAAGNDKTDAVAESPARFSSCLSVVNTGYHGLLHYTSTYGSTVDLAAPGVDIWSLYPNSLLACASGTSMATPMVSATAAMLYAVDGSITSNAAGCARIRKLLAGTTTDLYITGKDAYSGYGQINAYRALQASVTGSYSTASKKIGALTASNISYAAITLRWPVFSTASKYRVQRRKAGSRSYTTVATTTKRTYRVSGLTSGSKYTFRVLAYDTAGPGAGEWYLLRQKTVTPKPAKAKASAAPSGSRTVKISWKKVGGASGYQVYRAAVKTGTYKRIASTASSARSLKNTGLTKNKTYYYKVRAYRKVGSRYVYGSFSTIVSAVAR
ncbi:MAG: S8 family serine peptidase [Eubacteriales bacterium]|nr:S8 family serine peptidase [Eubacteriales bacterium]